MSREIAVATPVVGLHSRLVRLVESLEDGDQELALSLAIDLERDAALQPKAAA